MVDWLEDSVWVGAEVTSAGNATPPNTRACREAGQCCAGGEGGDGRADRTRGHRDLPALPAREHLLISTSVFQGEGCSFLK